MVQAASSVVPDSYLDAGTVSLSTPSTPSLTLQPYLGTYVSDYFTGDLVTVTGSGGKDVGAFTAILNLTPLTSVHMGTGTITRSQGQQVTWQGGAPGTYAAIGASLGSFDHFLTFTCFVATSAGQFTIPPWVLMALPAQRASAASSFRITVTPKASLPLGSTSPTAPREASTTALSRFAESLALPFHDAYFVTCSSHSALNAPTGFTVFARRPGT